MDGKTDFWQIFTQTGRVEDYLTYRRHARTGGGRGETHAPHDRRADHSGTGDRGT